MRKSELLAWGRGLAAEKNDLEAQLTESRRRAENLQVGLRYATGAADTAETEMAATKKKLAAADDTILRLQGALTRLAAQLVDSERDKATIRDLRTRLADAKSKTNAERANARDAQDDAKRRLEANVQLATKIRKHEQTIAGLTSVIEQLTERTRRQNEVVVRETRYARRMRERWLRLRLKYRALERRVAELTDGTGPVEPEGTEESPLPKTFYQDAMEHQARKRAEEGKPVLAAGGFTGRTGQLLTESGCVIPGFDRHSRLLDGILRKLSEQASAVRAATGQEPHVRLLDADGNEVGDLLRNEVHAVRITPAERAAAHLEEHGHADPNGTPINEVPGSVVAETPADDDRMVELGEKTTAALQHAARRHSAFLGSGGTAPTESHIGVVAAQGPEKIEPLRGGRLAAYHDESTVLGYPKWDAPELRYAAGEAGVDLPPLTEAEE